MPYKDKEQQKRYQLRQRRFNLMRIWSRRYSHMLARQEGRSTNYSNSVGKPILSKEEFYEWCMEMEQLDAFLTLYIEWAAAEFPLHLAPSVDRIDSDKGYVLGNLQWLSFSDNCQKNNINPIDHSKEVW